MRTIHRPAQAERSLRQRKITLLPQPMRATSKIWYHQYASVSTTSLLLYSPQCHTACGQQSFDRTGTTQQIGRHPIATNSTPMPSLPQGFLVFPQRHKGFEEPEGAQHRHVGCKVYVFQNQHQMITWPLQMKRDRINWTTRMISFTETFHLNY